MEAVSAAKMRKTQSAAIAGRPYARAALSILVRLTGTEHVRQHPLAKHRGGSRIALILITSDKGLAGALNSAAIKRAVEALENRPIEDVTIFAYGRKGEEYFTRRGYTIARSFINTGDDVPLALMNEIAHTVSDGFLRGEYDKVITVYNHFLSTFEQMPTMRRLLPLSVPALRDIINGITPKKGKWSGEKEMASEAPAAYHIESSEQEVLGALIPRLIAVAIYHMLLEAKASEHSARMVAMKNASDKSKEVASDLTRIYNKIRQAAITREVSEIISGREALAA